MVFTTKYKIKFDPTQNLYYLKSFEIPLCPESDMLSVRTVSGAAITCGA